MFDFIKKQSPVRVIALGFALVILLGSVLLIMPFSVQEGAVVHYIDTLYTSTSAVCVTGLIAIDAGDNFTFIGQFILAALIQIGGLGVTSVGAGIILVMGRKINLKERSVLQEALNLDSAQGILRFLKRIFLMTLCFEGVGAALSFIVFVQDYPPLRALWISIFHSVAAFNNSGFDILGNYQNLIPYRDNVMLNLITCGLIIFGGIGFLVIQDVLHNHFHWKKFSMHTKVVITVSAILIVVGAVLLKLTENITWLAAFFHSVSARTAGFSTYPLAEFNSAGLLVLIVLMFIKSAATNRGEKAFHYAVPSGAFRKAAVITLLALSVVLTGTWLMMVFEPQLRLVDALFEMTSAFGTVGLSTGITTGLGIPAKLISILTMYIGRLGPLTIASVWYFDKGERISYPEGNIAIG